MMLVSLIGLAMLGLKIYILYYLYTDAKESGRNPWLWILLSIFTSSIIALIVYKLVKEESKF